MVEMEKFYQKPGTSNLFTFKPEKDGNCGHNASFLIQEDIGHMSCPYHYKYEQKKLSG